MFSIHETAYFSFIIRLDPEFTIVWHQILCLKVYDGSIVKYCRNSGVLGRGHHNTVWKQQEHQGETSPGCWDQNRWSRSPVILSAIQHIPHLPYFPWIPLISSFIINTDRETQVNSFPSEKLFFANRKIVIHDGKVLRESPLVLIR